MVTAATRSRRNRNGKRNRNRREIEHRRAARGEATEADQTLEGRQEGTNQEVQACCQKGGKPATERSNKKAEAIAMMKRAKRRHTRGYRGSHRLAEAHGSRLRKHPGQQGWREDRVVEECQPASARTR